MLSLKRILFLLFGVLSIYVLLATKKLSHSTDTHANKVERRFKEMYKRVETTCKKYQHLWKGQKNPKIERFALEKYKLSTCLHAKVASSTLIYYLAKLLAPEKKDKDLKEMDLTKLHEDIRKEFKELYGGNETKYLEVSNRKDMFYFTFVRHPFDRLVSAYVDKILIHDTAWRSILRRDFGGISFTSWVKMIIKEHEKSPGEWHRAKVNRHYNNFHGSCGYCALKFDFIGKFENFEEDFLYIVKRKGLQHVLGTNGEIEKMNPTKKNNSITLNYFNQLTPDLKKQIFELFKIDFEMFGYDPKPFL